MPAYKAIVSLPPLRADTPTPVRFRVHPILGPDAVSAELIDEEGPLQIEDAHVSNHAVDEVIVIFVCTGQAYPGGDVRICVKVLSAEEQIEERGPLPIERGDGSDDDDFDGDESDAEFFDEE